MNDVQTEIDAVLQVAIERVNERWLAYDQPIAVAFQRWLRHDQPEELLDGE